MPFPVGLTTSSTPWMAKCDRCGTEHTIVHDLPRNEEGFEKMEQMMHEAGWRVAPQNRTYDIELEPMPDPARGNIPDGDLCPDCHKEGFPHGS